MIILNGRCRLLVDLPISPCLGFLHLYDSSGQEFGLRWLGNNGSPLTAILIVNITQSTDYTCDPAWNNRIDLIGARVHDWTQRSLLFRLWWLVRHRHEARIVLFCRNSHKLATLTACIWKVLRGNCAVVVEEVFHDFAELRCNRHVVSQLFSRIYYRLMMMLVSGFGVHTIHELKHLGQYRWSRSQPFFTRWHTDPKLLRLNREGISPEQPNPMERYLLVAGTCRDYACVIRAIQGTDWQCVIVARFWDRPAISLENQVSQIHCEFDIDWNRYFAWLKNAFAVIVPLTEQGSLRSLGHTQLLDAMACRIPVVCSRTFHVEDYVTDEEVIFYCPGDADDLRKKLNRLQDTAAMQRMTELAHQKSNECSMRNYVDSLYSACIKLSSSI